MALNRWLVVVVLIMLMLAQVALVADPYEGQQWYLDRIKAQQAWTITQGQRSIIVAVVDTGIDVDHPDLKDAVWVNADEIPGDRIDNDRNGYIDDVNGWNFLEKNNRVQPNLSGSFDVHAASHGTFISGIIAAAPNNGVGIVGVSSQVTIMPLLALDAEGAGTAIPVAEAINYAVDNGASVINLSFSGPDNNETLNAAIRRAYDNNVIVVAAAGNGPPRVDFSQEKMYPICIDHTGGPNIVIGVSSTDEQNMIPDFANYGDCIDVVAPGTNIVSDTFQNANSKGFETLFVTSGQGTSYSCALVTAAVALMKSVYAPLTVDDALSLLASSAQPIEVITSYTGKVGSGMLNVYGAVLGAQQKLSLLPSAKGWFFIAPDREKPTLMTRYDEQGQPQESVDVFGGVGGLTLAKGPVIDGTQTMVAGAGKNQMPLVRVLTTEGVVVKSFLAFENAFKGGVTVASSDVNGDGVDEYLVTPTSGRKPVVKIFSAEGKFIKEIIPYPTATNGGLSLSVGNVVGDAVNEIIVGAPAGAVPEVRAYSLAGKLLKTQPVFVPQFKGGVSVIAAKIFGTAYYDIVVAAGPGGGPHVMAFTADGQRLASFFTYASTFRGGVRLSVGDIDGDGAQDIITVPGPGGSGEVRVWNLRGQQLMTFAGLNGTYKGGSTVVFVGTKP